MHMMIGFKKFGKYLVILWMAFVCTQCNPRTASVEKYEFPELSGPFMGQIPPGDIPELFMPDVISTGLYTRDMAITPDGNEIYFCVSSMGYNLIFFTRQKNGYWTEPVPASFITDNKYMYYEPCISHDGTKMLFLSNMPVDEGEEFGDQDIWVVDREGDAWGIPYNLGPPVNSEGSEFFPSLTNDGTLYFTRQENSSQENSIYRSRLVDGRYTMPEKLGPEVNCGTNRFNAYIHPDESFIIVPVIGMEDAIGGADYYIVFRNDNDDWSAPVNMGPDINNATGSEWSPYISPDGLYFFFMASKQPEAEPPEILTLNYLRDHLDRPQNGNADIYWVKADFIQSLRPE